MISLIKYCNNQKKKYRAKLIQFGIKFNSFQIILYNIYLKILIILNAH